MSKIESMLTLLSSSSGTNDNEKLVALGRIEALLIKDGKTFSNLSTGQIYPSNLPTPEQYSTEIRRLRAKVLSLEDDKKREAKMTNLKYWCFFIMGIMASLWIVIMISIIK
jgi:hypothetical protein